MDKYGLINKIKSLEGLTDDEKSALLGLLRSHKKYGLVWEDKPEAVEEEMKDKLPVLTEVKDRAILNDTETEHYPNHILIEGDNLHALTVLSYTNNGGFDVIYIDPPYNTGHKDFTYNDQYVDALDSFRHSKWLSFMSKRLKIARKLLTEDGVIFISIDDNEQAPLKLLCDEIFGANNCLATIVQKSRDSISGDLLFSPNHNYLLVYARRQEVVFKDKDNFRIPSKVDESKYKNPDKDPRGPWKLNPVDGPGGARKGNPYYAFLGITGYYRYSKEMMQKYYDDGLIIKRKTSLGKKYFLSQAKAKKGDPPTTWWDDAGKTTNGTRLLKQIVPERDFNNPKPIELIIRCLQLRNKNAKVLDFFAGSGTTLHAVMELNNEDGGKRECILTQVNEDRICEEVTYVRNKRVIEGYTTPKGEHVEGLHGNNLRYYKTDFVPRERTVKNMRDLVDAATDMLCIKENMYKEQTLFGPWNELPQFIARHFTDGDGGEMIIIYDETHIKEFVKAISDMEFDKPLKVYVFSTDRDPYEDEFDDVLDKVELCALPAAIYDAYVQVMPQPQDKNVEMVMNSNEEDMDSWEESHEGDNMDMVAEERITEKLPGHS